MATYSPGGVPIPTPKPAQRSQSQAGTPQPEAGTDLRSGWQEFLSHPENRAGLLQFGLSMLSPADPGGSLASNIGSALGEGMAVRGATIEGQYQRERDEVEAKRKYEDHTSLVELRKAQTAKARRPPKDTTSTSKQLTAKDYTKEKIKYIKDQRKDDPDRPLAEITAEFDEVWAASTAPSSAPPAATSTPAVAGVTEAQINQMTLEQLNTLVPVRSQMTPAQRKAAETRYDQLTKK